MSQPSKPSAYAAAGVDIDAQEAGLSRVKQLARGTFTAGVLTEIGSFGGLFRPELAGMEEPVLVASADGVGTKLAVARMAGDYSSVGGDLVNHCVNDILVQGARPLFFLDYVGAGVLEPDRMAELIGGVAAGCKHNGCALLGGETAEMPGFYQPGDYELVGFIVGLVDRPAILDGSRVRPGDLLIGIASAGLHTNGYSLARRVFFELLGLGVDDPAPRGGDGSGGDGGGGDGNDGDGGDGAATVGELLLAPHLSYLSAIEPLLADPGLHALAHITGGGLTDNLPRALPESCRAAVELGRWPVPQLFRTIAEHGEVAEEEMLRVFNQGIGMVAVVAPEAAERTLGAAAAAGHRSWLIGRVEEAGGQDQPAVVYRGQA